MSLRGVIPPLVTPFQADGALDLASFEANLESLSAFDLAGFLVLGSNGEAASLEEEEKLALVAAARRGVAGGRLLLVGTGMESTRATIALGRRVADLGADAVLVLTPHYYKSRMTPDALRRHFEAVADASPVPVYLYSVPAFTGLAWPAGLAPTLAAHPRVAGMKESSGDVGLLSRIVASVPASFRVACGNAPVFYPALCAGAVAGVLAVANCAPRPVIGAPARVRGGRPRPRAADPGGAHPAGCRRDHRARRRRAEGSDEHDGLPRRGRARAAAAGAHVRARRGPAAARGRGSRGGVEAACDGVRS